MNDTNIGDGMVPHRKGCRCDECEAERLRGLSSRQKAVIRECVSQLEWYVQQNGPAASTNVVLDRARKYL